MALARGENSVTGVPDRFALDRRWPDGDANHDLDRDRDLHGLGRPEDVLPAGVTEPRSGGGGGLVLDGRQQQ